MKKDEFPVIPPERADDLHNLEMAETADLVLFMAGNQFMAMDEIVGSFQAVHPDVKNIFYETLPPGLELKQILARGARFRDRLLTVYPDIYSSVSEKSMRILADLGHIEENAFQLYLHNRLTLMVPQGNPAAVRSVHDLGRDGIRISQPDPENEDIAIHIIDMYLQAGGPELVQRIMNEKRARGTTLLTEVHHRQTPRRLLAGEVDVGPVWATEAEHARSLGLPLEDVAPGADFDQRHRINYYICQLTGGRNRENGRRFLEFIRSGRAGEIYRKYGFLPHE